MSENSTNAPQTRWLAMFKPILGAIFFLALLLMATGHSLAQVCLPYTPPQERFGVNVDTMNNMRIDDYDAGQAKAHWYLDYSVRITPSHPAGMQFVQMIRAKAWESRTFTPTVIATAKANPGAIWVLGNEPDRDGQDGLTPAAYAVFYHAAYTLLKQQDPTSRIAVAAVVQGTPLRLRYLNMVLDEYQARYGTSLPTDIWTVHGFTLPECKESGCWGASVPPGLEAFASEGKKYTIEDHGDIEIFKQNLIAFRQWMATHGYRDKPLILSEYGILLPPPFGFTYTTVRTYMFASFDFLLNTTDSVIGDPADGNRLVQSWSWFSLNSPPYDLKTGQGFNGNLFDPTTKQIQPLGQDFAAYVTNVAKENIDLTISSMQINPSLGYITATPTVTVMANLSNNGSLSAHNVAIQLWLNKPNQERVLLGQSPTQATVAPGCAPIAIEFQWQPKELSVGSYQLTLEIQADDINKDTNTANNTAQQTFLLIDKALANFSYLPLIQR